MPTKRTRRTRRRRDIDMPQWARRLLDTGEPPEKDSDDWNAYVGWRYFGDAVPGLPNEKDFRHANQT